MIPVVPDPARASDAEPVEQVNAVPHARRPAGPAADQHTDVDSADALRRRLAAETTARSAAERELAEVREVMRQRQEELDIVEELSGIGSFYWSVPNGRVWWSKKAKAILGVGNDDLGPDFDLFMANLHPDDRSAVTAVLEAALAAGGEYDMLYRLRVNGDARELRSFGRVEHDLAAVTGSLQDVTAVNAASRELRESRDRFAGVLNAATEQAIIATDPSGLITVFNAGAERMLGYTADEILGSSLERLHDAGEISTRAVKLGVEPGPAVVFAKAAGGTAETRDWTYLARDGRRLRTLITVNAMYGPDDEITGYMSVGTDITERIQTQAELRESEIRFRDTFEYAPNGMMLISVDPADAGRFVRVNPALCQLTGYAEAELLAMTTADLAHPDQTENDHPVPAALVSGHLDKHAVERHWQHADGHELWVQLSISPIRSRRDLYVVGQVEDITGRRSAEARLTHQALHDWLTGLPNRLLLMDRIDHALAASTRSGRQVGLIYIDLDGFKAVNDTGGHAAGDHALIQIGERIRSVVRPGDTVARLGGDEFVAVCIELDDIDVAVQIAERILAAIRLPYTHMGRTSTLGASLGVSLSGPDSEPHQMLREADEAMYAGKVAGKGRVRISGVHPVDPTAGSSRTGQAAQLEAELRDALSTDQLVLFGQTIHELTTRQVVAVEHLLRWNHPRRGLLEPADFLDVAEAADLMVPIGRRVIEESCRIARGWFDELGPVSPPVHLNIAGRQLESGRLLDDVLESLHRHGLPGEKLVLELTETHVPLLTDGTRRDLDILRERGVRIALDDLGTGHSSLSRLTDLPVDILKIDVSFVARMQQDAASQAIVHAILAVGRSLRLPVVSEGIETAEQLAVLLDAGCDRAQGFFFHRPAPAEELLPMLSGA